MSERFYTNCQLEPGPVELDGPEAHHLAAVCRLRPGDRVCLFNGDGADYHATVVDVAKKRVSLDVTERQVVDRELPFRLEVAVSLPKGDRGQFLIEKLTELGVAAFVPLICERSVIHPKESTLEKLNRYVIEASKQCGRNVLMAIEPVATWEMYSCSRSNEVRLFAHPGIEPGEAPRSDGPTASAFASGSSDHPTVRCAIGPEGGFSSAEVALAQRHAWSGIDLGPRILRMETAAIAVVLKAINAVLPN